MNNQEREYLGLQYNPFEPAASGAPLRADLWIPQRWKQQIQDLLDTIQNGQGAKAIAIEGEYGSGKTYLMRWLEQTEFPIRRIRPYFFDNPGSQFYDLANSLLRQIGRYEFSKALWEYVKPDIGPLQRSFFESEDSFTAWLSAVKRQKKQTDSTNAIARAIRESGITSDEEIAHRFAMIVVASLDKPFFEYRDFVAGRKDALVAENEEAHYFSAIIRALSLTGSVTGICFLLDEFEEVSLQKRLSRKEAQDYLATLKRLLNVASQQDFWLVVSMTPQAADISRQLEPALWERFTGQGQYRFLIPELSETEAEELLMFRLEGAYSQKKKPKLWPFEGDVINNLTPVTYSSPRRLVKVAFYAIAEAAKKRVALPLKGSFVHKVENKVYPLENR
jgi:hypothetical protein